MRAKDTPPLSDDARRILSGGTVEGQMFRLTCGTLDRPLYDEINEVLLRVGGKWKGGKTSAHVFGDGVDVKQAVAEVLASGKIPPKNPDAFFPTPVAVIDRMLEALEMDDLEPGTRILEPSAGDGAILTRFDDVFGGSRHVIDCVELDEHRANTLERLGYGVVRGDFLEFQKRTITAEYDRVMMNPPFTRTGAPQLYQDHLMHAWRLTAPGGMLACVCPAGLTSNGDERTVALRGIIHRFGYIETLPEDAFKGSGTSTRCVLVVMTKPTEEESAEEWRHGTGRDVPLSPARPNVPFQQSAEDDPYEAGETVAVMEKPAPSRSVETVSLGAGHGVIVKQGVPPQDGPEPQDVAPMVGSLITRSREISADIERLGNSLVDGSAPEEDPFADEDVPKPDEQETEEDAPKPDIFPKLDLFKPQRPDFGKGTLALMKERVWANQEKFPAMVENRDWLWRGQTSISKKQVEADRDLIRAWDYIQQMEPGWVIPKKGPGA